MDIHMKFRIMLVHSDLSIRVFILLLMGKLKMCMIKSLFQGFTAIVGDKVDFIPFMVLFCVEKGR